MPRRRRIQLPGVPLHVIAQGNRGQDLFRSANDFRHFTQLLAKAVVDWNLTCLTYCLMPNHYHLLIELNEPNLGAAMQQLNGDYARYFILRHQLPGRLFRGPYWAEAIADPRHVLALVRYIARNPVKHGFCARPEDWPWSAHDQLRGTARNSFVTVEDIYAELASDPERARRAYENLVADDTAPYTAPDHLLEPRRPGRPRKNPPKAA